jgi:hypothetical protein
MDQLVAGRLVSGSSLIVANGHCCSAATWPDPEHLKTRNAQAAFSCAFSRINAKAPWTSG